MELLNTADGGREALKGIPQPVFPVVTAGWGSNAALLMKDGKVAYLSIDQRRILWAGETHLSPEDIKGNFEANLFADERGIYLTSRTGASAFADDGRRLWLIRIRGAAAIPSFSDEGVLYSGGQDWILNAYKLEERVRAQKRVLYGPAPEGNYGTGEPHPELWEDYYFRYHEEDMDSMFAAIKLAIQEGRIGEREKEYASRLMDIAGSSLKSPRSELQPPVFVRHRVEAARLLAYIGSRETVAFLAELFTLDSDTLVKAAAAEALGKIGVDPEGLALRAFSNAIFPPGSLRDEQALVSVAAAAGAICRFSGPPLSDAGVRILTSLAGPDRPLPVRNQAERELKTLRL
jgi:outer membrane protein assembly factor BamB